MSTSAAPGRSVSGRSLRARLVVVLWLGFIAYPLWATFTDRQAGLIHLGVVSAAALILCIVYTAYCVLPDTKRALMGTGLQFGFAIVLVATVSFLVVYDSAYWTYSYTYCLWPVIDLAGSKPWSIPIIAAFGLSIGKVAGLNNPSLLSAGIIILGVGSSIYGIKRLILANETLRCAHNEAAAAAVAEERLRISRDLHELLGHSLSVIVLKSQVASRLAKDQPERALSEIGEIELVARQSLQEVRDAVSGYRRTSFAIELEAARRALGTAGISLQQLTSIPALAQEVETVLAWALREGITNIIRHSNASNCTVALRSQNGTTTMALCDDGTGLSPDPHTNGNAGNGLRGLEERVAAVRGTIQTGGGPNGGFCLSVSIPEMEALALTKVPSRLSPGPKE